MSAVAAPEAEVQCRVVSALAQDVGALIADSLATFRETCSSLGRDRDPIADLSAPNTLVLAARHARGDPLGYVVLVDRLHYGEVRNLFVRPDARGQGIARHLLLELEEQARMLGLTRMRLCRNAPSQKPGSLWRAFGYRDRATGGVDGFAEPGAIWLEKVWA